MRKSARQLEEPSGLGALLREGLVLTGGAIMRNPAAVGGTTAFLVAMAFVSANALMNQPHQHKGAFFSTRALVEHTPAATPQPRPDPVRFEVQPRAQQTTPAIASETTASLPGDPQVRLVQEVLKDLELYAGDVDGLNGPQTESAVAHYQRLVGLEPSGRIDDELLRHLGLGAGNEPASEPAMSGGTASEEAVPAVFVPADAPLPQPRPQAKAEVLEAALHAPNPQIVRIQAGLKAFGHDDIELDGVVGPKTRGAIKEFQALFGLSVTGEPDAAVYAKMREIGLTN